MGMFKALRESQKLAQEIGNNYDSGAQRKGAMARMAAGQEMMAQQTKAANLQATGIDATATITCVRSTGAMVNMEAVVELDLTVLPGGLPPYPLTVSQPVAQFNMPRVQPGSGLPVKIDPNDPASVWINFFGTA